MIIVQTQGGPVGRAATKDQRLAALPSLTPERKENAGRGFMRAIFGGSGFARVGARMASALSLEPVHPGATQFVGAFKAPRAFPRFNDCSQPSRGFRQRFVSPVFASAFHEQKHNTGVIPNVRLSIGEVRNVER